MCSRYIFCSYNGACNCKIRILSGTPCGFARICYKGECIPKPGQPNGQPCDCHSQCADSHAVCDPVTKTCVCSTGYYDDNGAVVGGTCLPQIPNNGSCTSNVQCRDPHAVCVNGICRCAPGYMEINGVCECFVCPAGLVQVGFTCVGTTVGQPCTATRDTCIDNNAYCNGTFCDCIPGFRWNGTLCVGPNLCDPCSQSTPSCAASLRCSTTTNRCECQSGYVQIGNNCYGTRLGEPCSSSADTCADNNANCIGSTCSCIAGFQWTGTMCVGPNLCDPCSQSTPSCAAPLQCSTTTNRCECQSGYVQIGNNCYGTRVGQSCSSSVDTCADNNADCNGSTCSCIAGFQWTGTTCVGSNLCDPCRQTPNSCAGNLRCDATRNRCECPVGYVQIGNSCHGTRVGDSCSSSTDTCADNNANCNGTTCDCVAGFRWNGTLCVGSSLCDPCSRSPDSCLPNFQCGVTTNRCECPAGKVQIGNNCFSLLCGSCTTSSDCLGANTACVGNSCQCAPGYYLGSCGTCLLTLSVNSSCSSNSQCTSGFCVCGKCQPNRDNDCCYDCTDEIADITFIMDSSGSVGTANYQLEKQFVIDMVNSFTVSQTQTRVAVVDFSSTVHSYSFLLNAYNNNAGVVSAITAFPYATGNTRTDLALYYTADPVYRAANGNRPGVKNFVIVITDGQSNSGANTPAAASFLKSNVTDLQVYSVGVTNSVNVAELQTIATNNSNVFLAPTFDALQSIKDSILRAICT